MNIFRSSRRARVFSALLIAFVFGAAMAGPAEAKGLKERLGFGKKHKKGAPPAVGISKPDMPENDAKAKADPAPPTTQRSVLLISQPEHGAEIAPGATIAFIKFNHIIDEVTEYYTERETVKYEDEELGISNFRTTVEMGGYDTGICARQVEAALAQHLADLNRFKVVTRDHIDTVLEEQHFANSGSVDTRTSARLGKLIGADILIYGQVQLCVSSRMNYEQLALAAASAGAGLTGEGGWMKNLVAGFKAFGPEKLRSFVLAQVQLIEAQTGKRVFTTSLAGEYQDTTNALSFDVGHRELIYRAADKLANSFIDNFLARQEARYIGLYAGNTWDFGGGIDLIQLGQCDRAERYFTDVYARYKDSMAEQDIARLMYNHGIALMCSNRPQEALDRLWASLRLSNDEPTFAAINFTNDIIDRGRHIRAEIDPIVRDVEYRLYPPAQPVSTIPQPTGAPEAAGSVGPGE